MKLAFIVQRYGRDILGGAETLARQIAERLSRRHEVTVLTTTAKDYVTWKNEYSEGEDKFRGVRILRFPVEAERDLDEFNKFSEPIYSGEPSREEQVEWLERQGPVVPALVEHLKKEHHKYDLLVFFTYLYYPTYYGLSVAPEKSVLVPTAHDEPPLKLPIYKEMFSLPGGFIFNTEAEELLVLERFPVHKRMRETIGIGMELLDQPDFRGFQRKHKLANHYLLYAGRIDAGKGVDELLRFFRFYKEENPASGNLQLVLIGRLAMKLPDAQDIRYLGFVSEAEKLAAMAGALAVVQSSRMESLSIVTLESFAVGTPVVVHSGSRVLVDHCRRANAGFYYRDFEEFEEILTLLLSDRSLGRALGKNGQRYVKDNYGWQKLLPKYELALRSMARPARQPRSAARRRGPARPAPEPERGPERREPREDVKEAAAVAESDDERKDEAVEPRHEEAVTAQSTPEPVEPVAAVEPVAVEEPAVAEEGPVPEHAVRDDDATQEIPVDSGLPSFYRSSARKVDEAPAEPDRALASEATRSESSRPGTLPFVPREIKEEEGLSVTRSAPNHEAEPEPVPVPEPEPEPTDPSLAKLPSFYRSTVEPSPERAATSATRTDDIAEAPADASEEETAELPALPRASEPERQRDEAAEKETSESEEPPHESGSDDEASRVDDAEDETRPGLSVIERAPMAAEAMEREAADSKEKEPGEDREEEKEESSSSTPDR